MDTVLLAPWIGDESVAGRQNVRALIDDWLRISVRILSPMIPAPVQVACEVVSEIEPRQKPRLEQRVIDKTIQVTFLRVEARIEPGLSAFLHMRADGVEIVVESS